MLFTIFLLLFLLLFNYNNKLTTKELRTILKDVLYNELEKIEELLESLEPKERLVLVIKILPFILPKVDKIGHTYNEPFDVGFM